MKELKELLTHCEELAFDLNFSRAKEWKAEDESRVLVGYMPVYFPREIVHAAGGLAVGIMGTGDRKQVVKGDAYYQSYICHIPRGIVELGLDGNLDGFNGFVFPSICDVIRNLSGVYHVLGVDGFIKYMDYPQNFEPGIGGKFLKAEMQEILNNIKKINGIEVTPEKLNESIQLYNENRRLIEFIYDIREKYPWRLNIEDVYHIIRAGMVIPVEEHNEILRRVGDLIKEDIGKPEDRIRVVVSGAFCEQPPVGLIKTIELAGCYVVDDDFLLGSRLIDGDIDNSTDDPLVAIANAFLKQSRYSSSIYDVDDPKEYRLAKIVEDRKANGVIFAAPSFCDPALLDAPIFQKAFDDMGIRYIAIQYNENTGQFKVIKEQVGAFSDSIKLWEDDEVAV